MSFNFGGVLNFCASPGPSIVRMASDHEFYFYWFFTSGRQAATWTDSKHIEHETYGGEEHRNGRKETGTCLG